MKQFLLLLSFSILTFQYSFSQVPPSERDALIAFYNATGGDNWTDNTNWNSANPVSTWFGVTTTIIGGQEHVIELRPNVNNLIGTIPVEITNLTELRKLWIQNNYLTGEIPSNIGDLVQLTQFVLNNNSGMTGSIPASFTNCTNLGSLYLQGQQFEGTIPDFTTLPNLTTLWIGYNNFEFGDFENEFVAYQTNFGTNFTYSNQGLVDTGTSEVVAIGYATTITANLSGSQNNYQWYKDGLLLDGETNPSLNITINSETDYGAYSYQATSNIVTGLILYSNNFNYDQAPSSTTDYAALVALYNSTDGANWINNTNWLNNTVPLNSWYGVTVENGRVTRLYLGSNNLDGPLPSEIGSFTELTELGLWANQLSGTIPPEIGNLSNLTLLDLSPNSFSGGIPTEIGNLTNLEILWLNQNGLSGNVPMSFQNLTSLREFHLRGDVGVNSDWSSSAYSGDFPDLTASPLEILDIQTNFFTFADIADEFATYQANIANFTFSPQYTIDIPVEESPAVGEDIVLSLTDVPGTSKRVTNNYQWVKDEVAISGANANTYTITNAQPGDSGIYYCIITNDDAPGMEVRRSPITINVGALGLEEQVVSNFTIYPNPTSSILNIKQKLNSKTDITLYNILGKKVLQKEFESTTATLNIAHLQTGIYILKLNTENGSITKRIIKN